MPALRRLAARFSAWFNAAVNRLTTVRADTHLKAGPPLESERTSGEAVATVLDDPLASLSQNQLLLYASTLKSDFPGTNVVRLMSVPPPRGLVNLIEILSDVTASPASEDIS